jgi:hypothetical protein
MYFRFRRDKAKKSQFSIPERASDAAGSSETLPSTIDFAQFPQRRSPVVTAIPGWMSDECTSFCENQEF